MGLKNFLCDDELFADFEYVASKEGLTIAAKLRQMITKSVDAWKEANSVTTVPRTEKQLQRSKQKRANTSKGKRKAKS